MARVMSMWLLMSISIKCCNSIDLKEPFGILMCRRKCNYRTGYLRGAFDASVLRCSLSENVLPQQLLQNKKVILFKGDIIGPPRLPNMKSTLTKKPNQKAAGTLPGIEGSGGQRCVYLKGITLELDMRSLHVKLVRLPNSKIKFTPSTHRFKLTMGGRFTAVLYSSNIYFFNIVVSIERQAHGNAMYCAVGVCLRKAIDTAKHIGDQTDTWGFSLQSTLNLMYIRKLGSKQRYAWAKDRMSNRYPFGLLVDLTQGRLLVTDPTGRRSFLNIAGLPTNSSLIPVMESLPYRSLAVRITGRKLPNKEEHIVKHIKHNLNGSNLCDENSSLQAKGKYSGKIHYASIPFLPSEVPSSCRLTKGWLMIGRLSNKKRAFHWKPSRCGMHDQIMAHFNFKGHKVFFWSFKVDIKNKVRIVKSSYALKTRKICLDIYYEYGKFSPSHPTQWGFKFYMNPWNVSIQTFPQIKKYRPWIYLPLSISRYVIILDKISGRLLLVEPEYNKVIAMVKGVHGSVDPKLIFCFCNSAKFPWRLALKPELEDETSYTRSQVQDVLGGFDQHKV